MSQFDTREPADTRLPRHDLVLLPLLSLLTIAGLIGGAKAVARKLYPHSNDDFSCVAGDDKRPALPHGNPGADCWLENRDSPVMEYRLNACGHRTLGICGAKTPGTYRIVVVGSSFGAGESVPVEKDFAELLPGDIAERTGRRIDLYNQSMFAEYPAVLSKHLDEVLAQKPDLILWNLTLYDLPGPPANDIHPSRASMGLSPTQKGLHYLKMVFAPDSTFATLQNLIHQMLEKHSRGRLMVLLQHFLYLSDSRYLAASLSPSTHSYLLMATPSALEQTTFPQFQSQVASVLGQARDAHVPVAVVLLPDRVLADLLSSGDKEPGWDVYRLDGRIREVVTANGGIYLDVLPRFSEIPDAGSYYFPIDRHPNERGHRLIAEFMADALTDGRIPALATVSSAPVAAGNGVRTTMHKDGTQQ